MRWPQPGSLVALDKSAFYISDGNLLQVVTPCFRVRVSFGDNTLVAYARHRATLVFRLLCWSQVHLRATLHHLKAPYIIYQCFLVLNLLLQSKANERCIRQIVNVHSTAERSLKLWQKTLVPGQTLYSCCIPAPNTAHRLETRPTEVEH